MSPFSPSMNISSFVSNPPTPRYHKQSFFPTRPFPFARLLPVSPSMPPRPHSKHPYQGPDNPSHAVFVSAPPAFPYSVLRVQLCTRLLRSHRGLPRRVHQPVVAVIVDWKCCWGWDVPLGAVMRKIDGRFQGRSGAVRRVRPCAAAMGDGCQLPRETRTRALGEGGRGETFDIRRSQAS